MLGFSLRLFLKRKKNTRNLINPSHRYSGSTYSKTRQVVDESGERLSPSLVNIDLYGIH